MRCMPRTRDFRGPFWLPGTRLFSDYCAACLHRYCLTESGVLRKGKVGGGGWGWRQGYAGGSGVGGRRFEPVNLVHTASCHKP